VFADRAQLPTGPGVYRFRDARGRALYVGRATNLRRRVGSYRGDLGERWHLRSMVARIERVEVLLCASEHEAAWLERNALEHSMPPWNRTAGGQESPVFIQLTESARAPGLKVVFRPGADRHFGPYLGGTKARLGVSALHRLFPLSYTAQTLTDAERAMAAKRLVHKEDRESLLESLKAVLGREPAAVAAARQCLIELRDGAAAELAFERAGRIQEELTGFDWITSPQRATALEPYDLVFHGWAGETLVRFEVRAGRLIAWRALPCSRDRAEAKLAATPPQWAPFAQANAEIAASLR
jgi:excinuclease ABC subunit C